MSNKLNIVGHYWAVLFLLFIGVVLGFGIGFEYGTGIPVTSLFATGESVATPTDITRHTTADARSTMKEALQNKTYGPGYNCLDYAWTAMRALNWDSQPAAIAALTYDDGTGHALILTATEDDGWIFLDPRTGMLIKPTIGGKLMDHTVTGINILTVHWVPTESFKKDPTFEVYAK